MTLLIDDAVSNGKDARLSLALGLLSQTERRPRHGLLSLAAVTGLAVSGTLLLTLLSGEGKPDKPVSSSAGPVAASADFELSDTPAHIEPVQDAVLIGTER